MAESFPGASADDGGSFPRGPLPDAETVSADAALLFRRYRVRRELGRGGMGVVLLAYDTALDIDVAVKLVPDLMVKDTEAVADLRKEVLRGMALAHPGIVRTHNFEKDESGAGIVMEFIDGESLTEAKLRQPEKCFDPEEILPWLEQLCAVLDYAHLEARIIHRDLKPRNIMLTRAGRLKVADFGIAAVVSDSMSRHSMEGKVSGTLSYMSPQQAEGRRPSHLDDIYALGATIYELLTGKPPFFRGNPASIQAQVFGVTPPGVAERREDLEVKGRAAIPPQWEDTLTACLAKDPAQRPQTAGEVLARLKAPAQGRAASPPPTIPPAPEARTLPGAAAAAQGGRNAAPPRPATAPPHHPSRRWPWVAVLAAAAGLAVWAGIHFGDTSRDDSRLASETHDPSTPLPVVQPTPPPQPKPAPAPATPVPATPQPATPEPATPAPAPPPPSVATATKDAPFVNSLGMKFVPAGTPGVLFCIWETRVKDFAAFIEQSGYDMTTGEKAHTIESGGWKQAGGDWRNPRFPEPQGEDHAVVCVSWEDAKAFCAWLTNQDRASGLLVAAQSYRLPADHEWSVAVGIGDREDASASPESKDKKIADIYPWGARWPPPAGAGNFAGSEANIGAFKSNNLPTISGYRDGFARTAPVGQFTANSFGLYDLAGNVWEWVDDWWNAEHKIRVLRGGSWFIDSPGNLRSSFRLSDSSGLRLDGLGFRCVVGAAAGSPMR